MSNRKEKNSTFFIGSSLSFSTSYLDCGCGCLDIFFRYDNTFSRILFTLPSSPHHTSPSLFSFNHLSLSCAIHIIPMYFCTIFFYALPTFWLGLSAVLGLQHHKWFATTSRSFTNERAYSNFKATGLRLLKLFLYYCIVYTCLYFCKVIHLVIHKSHALWHSHDSDVPPKA